MKWKYPFKEYKFLWILTILCALGMAVLGMSYCHLSEILEINDSATIVKRMIQLVVFDFRTYLLATILTGLFGVLIQFPKALDWAFRYRYILALLLWVICVCLKWSGSSMGMWCVWENQPDGNLLAGISRDIRSDEFSVSTPSFYAQKMSGADNAFAYFSDVLNGTTSDLFYGIRQPIAEFGTIFRPFLLGYLFLPADYALSFYWMGRGILLFMASFELGLLITKQRRGLSLCLALLISLAPIVQWWYSTTIVDQIIYMAFSMTLFAKYLKEPRFYVRLVELLGILWCAGSFVMLLYPAWQIPFAILILVIAAWIAITNWKERKLRAYDYICMALGVGALAVFFILTLKRSAQTIETITNTVYPGARFETGGGYGVGLFTYGADAIFAITDKGFGLNTCEAATFIDFFPICLILPLLVFIKERKKDLLLIVLMVVDVLLLVWIVCGLPSALARYSFLYNCPAKRVLQMVGLVNLLVMFRALSLLEQRLTKPVCVALAGGGMGLAGVVTYVNTVADYANYMSGTVYAAMLIGCYALLALALFFLLRRIGAKETVAISAQSECAATCSRSQGASAIGAILTLSLMMFLAGGMVNPLRNGSDAIYELDWIEEIERVAKEDGKEKPWAVLNSETEPAIPYSDLGLWAGVKTVNATAIYPNMSMWKELDPNGRYEEVYNRFAHINLIPIKSGESRMELVNEDTIRVMVTLDDLYRVGVRFVTARYDLSEYAQECKEVTAVKRNQSSEIEIYELTARLLYE